MCARTFAAAALAIVFALASLAGAASASVTVEGESIGDENGFDGALKVIGNGGGTTVLDNAVAGNLTVTGNSAPVLDAPNSVEGKSKLQ